MNLTWLSNHWSILGFVFVLGGAAYAQEEQIQTIEEVITRQTQIIDQMEWGKEVIIRLDEQVKASQDKQDDIEEKLDYLIKLQIEKSQ